MNGSKAKYELIQSDITDKIQRGIYKANDRIPSEKELMDAWNVSRITASKALTELSLNGYIYRIQGKGSFVSPITDRINQRTSVAFEDTSNAFLKKIGLIIPARIDPHAIGIISGVNSILSFPKYFTSVVVCSNGDEESYSLEYMLQNGYSGVILYPVDFEFYSDIILKMTLDKYPLVLIDRRFPGINCASVTSDNECGCKLAIKYLAELGHEKIAYISQLSHRDQIASLRYEHYSLEMIQRGLIPISCDSFKNFTDKVKSGDITACLACNSPTAKELYDICKHEGINIPEDLSIICFDNPSRFDAEGFLSFIDQDSYGMGKHAAKILQKIIEEKETESIHSVTTPKLIINKSTKELRSN